MQFNLIMGLSLSLISSLAYSAAQRERTYEERYAPASLSEAMNFCTTIPCIPKAVQFYIRTHPNEEALVKSNEVRLLILHKKQMILKKIAHIIQENADQQRSMMYSPMLIKINELGKSTKINDYSIINKTLQMALQQAATIPNTNESLFKILIENGASPQRILLWMLPYDLPSMSNVDLLIKYGLNVNERDYDGETALIKLAYGDKAGTLEFAKFLVSRGANINLANRNGYTPLMRATAKRPYPFLDMVKWLLSLHVDVLKTDNSRMTALDLARERSERLGRELDYYRRALDLARERSERLGRELDYYRKSRKVEDISQYREKQMVDEIIRLLEEAEEAAFQQRFPVYPMTAPAA